MLNAGHDEPDLTDLIESIPGKGYRLNPTRVRLVDLNDLLKD